MRKVTASAVILTAITGCSQNQVPSAQWSFDVPADLQDGSESAPGIGRSESPLRDSAVRDSLAPFSSSDSGFVARSNSSNIAALNSDIAVPSLLRPDPIAQARAYLDASGSAVQPRPQAVNRVPYSSQAYLPAAPNYTPATASLDSLAPVPFAVGQTVEPAAEQATTPFDTASVSANATQPMAIQPALTQPVVTQPEPIDTPQPFFAPEELFTAAANSPFSSTYFQNTQPSQDLETAFTPRTTPRTTTEIQAEVSTEAPATTLPFEDPLPVLEAAPSEPLSPAAPLLVAATDPIAPTQLETNSATFPAFEQPSAEVPTEVAISEASTRTASAPPTLERLLHTLPQRDTEPAILSVIRADQQARALEPAVAPERISPAVVSPLLEELQSSAESAPLQAIHVPIADPSSTPSSTEVPAAFILSAIAALSEEANTVPVLTLAGTDTQPTQVSGHSLQAEAVLAELTQAKPSLPYPYNPTATLVRLNTEAAPEIELSLDELSVDVKEDIKGTASKVDASRYQSSYLSKSPRQYRQRIVWQ